MTVLEQNKIQTHKNKIKKKCSKERYLLGQNPICVFCPNETRFVWALYVFDSV